MLLEKFQKLVNNPLFKENVAHDVKRYQAQVKIIEEGKPHRYVYIVKSGGVRVVVHSKSKEHKGIQPGIADLGPGETFGEFAIFDDEPASADVVTTMESELIEVEIESLKKFLKDHPDLGYKVLLEIVGIVIKRMRHTNKTVLSLLAWGIKSHQIDKHLTD